MRAKPTCPTEISTAMLERMAAVLKLLAHPCRLRIIELLERRQEVPVHEIVVAVGLTQGATSQHLNLMKRVGLVASERRGREVYYRIDDDSSLTILSCLRRKGQAE